MTIALHSFRTTLRALTVPAVAALALCWLGLGLAPDDAGTGADHSAGQWLHVPGLLLVAAALGAVLESWPLFSRARPGADWVRRLESGPLHGCVAASVGTLGALSVALLVTALGFDVLAGTMRDRGAVAARLRLERIETAPFLDHSRRHLTFRVRSDAPIGRIKLRPTPIFSDDVRPAGLRITADGERLHTDPWLWNLGEPIELRLTAPRPIHSLRIERRAGPGLVLRLLDDRLEVIAAARQSSLVNSALALLTYVCPALLALALMTVGHVHLALPVNLLAGLIATLLATLLEFTPSAQAITAYSRGHWLLGEVGAAITEQALTVIAAAIALLLPAAMLGRQRA